MRRGREYPIKAVRCQVNCGGKRHSILLSKRGALRFLNHDSFEEMDLLQRITGKCRCFIVYEYWRSLNENCKYNLPIPLQSEFEKVLRNKEIKPPYKRLYSYSGEFMLDNLLERVWERKLNKMFPEIAEDARILVSLNISEAPDTGHPRVLVRKDYIKNVRIVIQSYLSQAYESLKYYKLCKIDNIILHAGYGTFNEDLELVAIFDKRHILNAVKSVEEKSLAGETCITPSYGLLNKVTGDIIPSKNFLDNSNLTKTRMHLTKYLDDRKNTYRALYPKLP